MKNFIKEILQMNGHKVTPARLAILDVFMKNKTPLNAETVYEKLLRQKKVKNINEVTVYRTLSRLGESGILKRVDLRRESAYFELADRHHHHIICTNCDTVEDFKNLEVEKVLGRIVEKSSAFKKIKEHSLELFGLCAKCS